MNKYIYLKNDYIVGYMEGIDAPGGSWIEPVITLPADIVKNEYFYTYTASPETVTLTGVPRIPPVNSTWDIVNGNWIESRTLQEAKDAKWESIKEERDEAIAADIAYAGNTYPADTLFRVYIAAEVVRREHTQVATNIDIVTADGTRVSFTSSNLKALSEELISQATTEYQYAADLKGQVDAETTIAGVDPIDYGDPIA